MRKSTDVKAQGQRLLVLSNAEMKAFLCDCRTPHTTAMGLLAVAGLDCAGAVQLSTERMLPDRESATSLLSEAEVGARLWGANLGQPVAGDGERWSVAGQQGKIALQRTSDGQWSLALGGLPTTHIIKPGVTRLSDQDVQDQALTEHLTLKAAASLGTPSAETECAVSDGSPLSLKKRFDRNHAAVGGVLRSCQEDFCQALGVDPSRKYEKNGGPSVRTFGELLTATATPRTPYARSVLHRFARMVAYNNLSGSPDAHAKNFSLMILPTGQMLLSPMYDSATGLGLEESSVQQMRHDLAVGIPKAC
jgi:serine/threonine-protein kinase HipA